MNASLGNRKCSAIMKFYARSINGLSCSGNSSSLGRKGGYMFRGTLLNSYVLLKGPVNRIHGPFIIMLSCFSKGLYSCSSFKRQAS